MVLPQAPTVLKGNKIGAKILYYYIHGAIFQANLPLICREMPKCFKGAYFNVFGASRKKWSMDRVHPIRSTMDSDSPGSCILQAGS